jgi:lipoate-protein ligase A
VDHQQFCESVLAEFEREYNQGINVQPTIIDQHTIHELPEQVEKTRQELCTWEWMYGQTPEFTHTLDNEFEWGHVVSKKSITNHSFPLTFFSLPPFSICFYGQDMG